MRHGSETRNCNAIIANAKIMPLSPNAEIMVAAERENVKPLATRITGIKAVPKIDAPTINAINWNLENRRKSNTEMFKTLKVSKSMSKNHGDKAREFPKIVPKKEPKTKQKAKKANKAPFCERTVGISVLGEPKSDVIIKSPRKAAQHCEHNSIIYITSPCGQYNTNSNGNQVIFEN